jgi:hypothetical protein
MDVTLRAVSWAIGLELCTTAVRRVRVRRSVSALFDHGVFIRGNLENTYEVTSNHFLSNVVGLLFLAPSSRSAERRGMEHIRQNVARDRDQRRCCRMALTTNRPFRTPARDGAFPWIGSVSRLPGETAVGAVLLARA